MVAASQIALVVKNLPANAEDMRCGSIPGSGKISREGPPEKEMTTHSDLENSINRGVLG